MEWKHAQWVVTAHTSCSPRAFPARTQKRAGLLFAQLVGANEHSHQITRINLNFWRVAYIPDDKRSRQVQIPIKFYLQTVSV